MAWLEITLNTPQGSVDSLATALTGLGFADLCIEDQQEFETFLEENREYWDYIDEDLEKKLRSLGADIRKIATPEGYMAQAL